MTATPPAVSGVELKRAALVAAVLLSNLLLAGLIYGWAPLLLMLQQEQQYVELCDFGGADSDIVEDDNSATAPRRMCVAQENRLNLMFTVASVTMGVSSLPIGFFLDRAGPKLAIAAAALVEVSGLLLLAYADSQEFDVFLLAYTLLALGGNTTLMASFPASFLIMQYQTAILAAISCLFDGSSVVFLVLLSFNEGFGFSRQKLLVALAGVAGVLFVALVALWHVNERALGEDEPKTASNRSGDNEQESQSLLASHQQQQQQSCSASEEYASNNFPALVDSAAAQYESMTLEVEQLALVHRRIDDEFELVDVSIGKQIRSFAFSYIAVFSAVQMLRATIYIGTTNKLLTNYGDRQHDFFFTKVFSFVLPLGFLFVPAINHIVEKKGLTLSLLFTNVIGAAYNILAFVPSLQVQSVTFFVFAGYRAFLYAVMLAFTAKTFGLKSMGSLMGIIFTAGAVASLAEYPAVYLSNVYFEGDLTALYGFSLLICLLIFPFTGYLRKHEVERERSKQALIEQLTSGGTGGNTSHALR